MDFREEVLDSYKGEMVRRIIAIEDGNILGYVKFSTMSGEDTASILHVEVVPGRQRQGIATALYDRLSEIVGGADRLVTHGFRTPDGVAFRASYDKRSGLTEQWEREAVVFRQLRNVVESFHGDVIAGIDPVSGAELQGTDRWNDLHDLSDTLDRMMRNIERLRDVKGYDLPDELRLYLSEKIPDLEFEEQPVFRM